MRPNAREKGERLIRVRHNGDERLLDPARFESLGEAVTACLEGDAGDGAILHRVRLNGHWVPERGLDALLALPLEGITDIELESRSARAVAVASLESARAYLPNVLRCVRRTAALLRSGRIEEANGLYAATLDALGVLVFALRAAGSELPEAEDLREVEGEWSRGVAGLLAAQEIADWIRVADALEYELTPLLEGWEAGIRRAQERIGEDDGRRDG